MLNNNFLLLRFFITDLVAGAQKKNIARNVQNAALSKVLLTIVRTMLFNDDEADPVIIKCKGKMILNSNFTRNLTQSLRKHFQTFGGMIGINRLKIKYWYLRPPH